jgi:hypothetical protein
MHLLIWFILNTNLDSSLNMVRSGGKKLPNYVVIRSSLKPIELFHKIERSHDIVLLSHSLKHLWYFTDRLQVEVLQSLRVFLVL